MSESLQDFVLIPRRFIDRVSRPLKHYVLPGMRGYVLMTFNGKTYRQDVSGTDADSYTLSVQHAIDRINADLKLDLEVLYLDRFEHDA